MNKKSFTLIEIVMVMVITGLLAAIVIPKYAGYRQKAALETTYNNMMLIVTAITVYYSDNGEWPPGKDHLKVLVDQGYLKEIPRNPLSVSSFEEKVYHMSGHDWVYQPAERILKNPLYKFCVTPGSFNSSKSFNGWAELLEKRGVEQPPSRQLPGYYEFK